MKVKSESEVAQSCSTLSDPMDCSLPVSSIHGIFQARILEWGAIAFSKKEIKSTQIRKEEVKLSLFANDVIPNIKHCRDSIKKKKLLELINEFSKIAGLQTQYIEICCISIY